jgi:hypothetical protein
MTNIDIEELRKLAEDAIARSDRWHLGRGDGIEQSQATALAHGILSALDALEAANKERDEADEKQAAGLLVTPGRHDDGTEDDLRLAVQWAEAAEAERDRLSRELNDAIAKHQQRWGELERAKGDVDRLVKERDESREALRGIKWFAERWREYHTGFVHILWLVALAGVPGEAGKNPDRMTVTIPASAKTTTRAVPGEQSDE